MTNEQVASKIYHHLFPKQNFHMDYRGHSWMKNRLIEIVECLDDKEEFLEKLQKTI